MILYFYMYLKIIKFIPKVFLYFSILIFLFTSFVYLYQNRYHIKYKILKMKEPEKNHMNMDSRFLVNSLEMSTLQIPPNKIENLEINNDAHIKGQWSAPIDWNVTAIHSSLLPDYSVMTFGSFGIDQKEQKDLRENKKITLTDGRTMDRDGGIHQWKGHDVNSGVDFDIWHFKKGFGDESHLLLKKPILMDSFCSVVRVIDSNNVFIVGGNKNLDSSLPDTQNYTAIYNIKEKKFTRSNNLNFKRWYGSIVRTGDNKFIILGGKDVVSDLPSTTPELFDLNKKDSEWKLLNKAKSNTFFGRDLGEEWSYPRSYLVSDGNIVGISYNKIWNMNKNKEYRVTKTNEIKLESGGISAEINHVNTNNPKDTGNLRILTMGSPVGDTNSSVMIGKDKVYIFGGKQTKAEYSASNKVLQIDFSDSFNPKIKELNPMFSPRSNGNATILPNGNVFLNGGTAYSETHFSNFVPEIYNIKRNITKEMSKSYFRRNYHSSSILLPDGTILTGGGDVWNAEIFYPPYLFTKNWENKTVLAKRPELMNVPEVLNRGKTTLNINTKKDISKITIISTGSTTHAQGSESKYRSLKFEKLEENEFQINIPLNPNELQDGTYLIFAIGDDNVPSEGKIIYLN